MSDAHEDEFDAFDDDAWDNPFARDETPDVRAKDVVIPRDVGVTTQYRARLESGGGVDISLLPYLDPDDDDDDDDDDDTVTVHGRVVREEQGPHGGTRVVVADETGSTMIGVGDTDIPDAGAEIEISDCTVRSDRDILVSSTRESDVTLVDDPDDDVGWYLRERSILSDAEMWYDLAEYKADARERVVAAYLSEHDVMSVMDDDEVTVWVYDDDLDSHPDAAAWRPNAKNLIKSTLNKHLPAAANTRHERNEITDQIVLETLTHDNPFSPGPPEGGMKWTVPVLNGLIDLREPPEQDPEPHDPDHYTTIDELLPVEHNPDADGDEIDDVVSDIGVPDAMRRTIYEMYADAAMRNNDFRRAYINVGPAQSGKSVVAEIMSWMLGDGYESIAFERLVSDDFEAAATMRSYAVVDDDSSAKKITSNQSHAFKRFLGVGDVRSGAKHQRRETHTPYATVVLNVNDPPVWEHWDTSIRSRLLPLFFNERFVDDPDPDDPHEHEKRAESELEAELRTKEELSGLLNHVIRAANRLHQSGEWSIEEDTSHDELLEKYRNYADTTRRFADEMMVETDEAVRIRKEDWHTIYRRWAQSQGLEPQDTQQFWTQIKNDETTYVEFVNPYKSKRSTEYVRPSKQALEYAPEPVKERIQDKVAGVEPNASDEVTRVTDLSMGAVAAVKGEIVSRRTSMDTGGIVVRIDDGTGMIDVHERVGLSDADDDSDNGYDTDGVYVGDTIRVENATVRRRDGAPEVVVDATTTVTVVDPGPMQTEDASSIDDYDTTQSERRRQVYSVIESSGDGVAVEDVVDQVDADEDHVRHDVDALIDAGEIYQPESGVLRVT